MGNGTVDDKNSPIIVSCNLVGINDRALEDNSLAIYPNPASHNNISIHLLALNGAYLQIYDAVGKIILTKQLNNSINDLSVDGLPKGMYLFKILSNEKTLTKKVIIN